MTQPPRARPRKGSRAKSFLIGLLIGLVCALAAYFIGKSKGSAGAAAAQARAVQAEGRVSALEATNQLLRARAQLSLAATNLERRNFGTASTDVQAAAAMLESVPSGAPVDAERVSALRKQIEEVKINVSDDVGRQRSQLLDLAAQIDTLLPAPPAAEAAPEPTPSAGAAE